MSSGTEAGASVATADAAAADNTAAGDNTVDSMAASTTLEPPKANLASTTASSLKSSPRKTSPSPVPLATETKVSVPPKVPSPALTQTLGKHIELPKETATNFSKKEQDEQEKAGKPVAGKVAEGKRSNGEAPPKSLAKREQVKDEPVVKKKSNQAPSPGQVSTSKTHTKTYKSPVLAKSPVEKTPAKSSRASSEKTKSATATSLAAKPRVEKDSHIASSKPKSSHPSSKPAAIASPPLAASAGVPLKKVSPLAAVPPAMASVKSKPKSPTKPVKLPASLTAPTASSVSKTGGGGTSRQTPSRTSNYASPLPMGRSPSRASVGAPTSQAQRPLRRQSSAINRQRPSLGPPPKQSAKDHAPCKKEKEVDESFLARMMRPTQSSASKAHEKVQLPTTPPRKPAVAKRMSDHGAHSVKKTTPIKKSPSVSRESSPQKALEAHESPTRPQRATSPTKTPSVAGDEEEQQQPTNEKTEEVGDDTLVEKGDSPATKDLQGKEKMAVSIEPEPDANASASANAETKVEPKPSIPQVIETLPTPVEPAQISLESAPEPEDKAQSEAEDAHVEEPISAPEQNAEQVPEQMAELLSEQLPEQAPEKVAEEPAVAKTTDISVADSAPKWLEEDAKQYAAADDVMEHRKES